MIAPVPIPVGPGDAERLERADVVIDGLEQGGGSYELRVFVNNPDADAATDPTPVRGYAGSVYVYGYGLPPERLERAPGEPAHVPMSRYVVATEAIRAAAGAGNEASITLVPVVYRAPAPDVDLSRLGVSILIRE